MNASRRRLDSVILLVGMVVTSAAFVEGQSLSIPDRVQWEEAMLAYEEGATVEALSLLEEVLAASGPVPAILYDAARVAFELREYLRAEEYITVLLETEDEGFRATPEYDDAFRVAARIRRTLRPLRSALVDATPLPFSDNLARAGFAVPRKDPNSACEWKFDRGGLVGKHKSNVSCMNGDASSAGRVRIELTLEKRGGGSKAAGGIVFGRQDKDNYYFLRVHPEWQEADGDVSIVSVRDGRQVLSATSFVYDNRNRPLRRWSKQGPWKLAVEVRGRRIDWFLNEQHVGTEYADREIEGSIMTGVAGSDGGEFLFKNLWIGRLPPAGATSGY